MIYGNTGLVYVNLDQNLLVAYSKSDIKEVNRERVHTGSHTSSNTVGVGDIIVINLALLIVWE